MIQTINTITNVVLILVLAVAIFGGLFFLINYLSGKGKPKVTPVKATHEVASNVKRVSELLPIDDVKNRMIPQNNGKRFSAIVKCYGFDFFRSDDSAKETCIQGYQAMLRNINSTITLNSAYRSYDISKQIAKHQDALQVIEGELNAAKEKRERLASTMASIPVSAMAKYETEFAEVQLACKQLEGQKAHMESMIAYLDAFLRGGEQQYQDYSYIVSWDYNEAEMPNLDEDAKEDEAIRELNESVANLRNRLGSIGVTTRRYDNDDLMVACYRHTHPSGRNMSDQDILNIIDNESVTKAVYSNEEVE